MAIGVLVEALLPGVSGGGGGAIASGGEAPPKDEKGLKEWIRNKLKALASLLGRLGIKAAVLKHCLESLEELYVGFLIELAT